MPGTRNKLVANMLLYGIGVISVIFLVELAYFTFGEDTPEVEKLSVELLDLGELPSVRSMGSEDDFREIVDRPLFTWNREPVPIEEAIERQGTTGDIEMRWELSGIVVEGEVSHAYFSEIKGGRSVHLEEGMYLENWRVETIQAEQVLLSDSGEEKTFRFKAILRVEKPKAGRARLAKRNFGAVKAPVNTGANARPNDEEPSRSGGKPLVKDKL